MFETTNQLWLINAKNCRASWVLLSLTLEHGNCRCKMNIMMCMMRIHAFANEQRIRGSHSFNQLHTVSATSTALWEPFKPFIPRSFLFFFSEIKQVSNQESFFRPVALSIHWSVHSVAIGDHHPMLSHSFWLKIVERLRRLRSGGTPKHGGHSTPMNFMDGW